MLSLSKFFIFSLVATSALADYVTILAALHNPVDSPDIPNLRTSISNYPKPAPGTALLQIQKDNKKLVNDITKVASDIKSSTAFTAAQGKAIVDYVCGPIITDIKTVFVAVDGQKAALIAAGAASLAKNELTRLKTGFDNFFDTLIGKCPTSALKTTATGCKKTFDDECQKRINYFG